MTDKTPERESRRRRPHELIGPHCDVYSLGKSIQNATDLLKFHHENPSTRLQNDFKPRLGLVYTSDLWNLMNRCQIEDARFRPRLHYLYTETKIRMEHYRRIAQAEEADASRNGNPGCFHSNVLFKKADRIRFETDPVFRSDFKEANLKPVWELLGTPPSGDVPRVNHSVALGEDGAVNVKEQDVVINNVRVGGQRGGMPARGERKIERLGREKKKRGARIQQGIRGLLSKMNFFS